MEDLLRSGNAQTFRSASENITMAYCYKKKLATKTRHRKLVQDQTLYIEGEFQKRSTYVPEMDTKVKEFLWPQEIRQWTSVFSAKCPHKELSEELLFVK